MRIRRRPQAQVLSRPAGATLHPSDPSIAPQPPPNAWRNQQHWLLAASKEEEEEEEEEGRKKNRVEELHHLHRNADLGDEPSAALPLLPQVQGNVVGCSESPGGVGGGAQRFQGAADGHRSLENGHRDKSEQPVINAGERLVNGTPAMPVARVTVNVKEEVKNDNGGGGSAAKKRRGPAVLMEGSRCSRVNGRGWRCSQPTLVGYSLCEHHLGKGRTRSSASANGAGRGGGAQLGRTDPGKKSSAAAAAAVAVVTAARSANDPPSVQHF